MLTKSNVSRRSQTISLKRKFQIQLKWSNNLNHQDEKIFITVKLSQFLIVTRANIPTTHIYL